MLSEKRLLIVESEFLIALDIQRVVEGAQAGHTVFARNWREVGVLHERIDSFDLAIVTPPAPNALDEQAAAARLLATGTAIVVCSAVTVDLSATPLAGAETVHKPFKDDVLLAACSRALARPRPVR